MDRTLLSRLCWTRWLLVASQVTTLALTWPLWLTRDDFPPLDPFDLAFLHGPWLQAGPWILASLALVLWRPRWGVPAHAAVLALAMLQDELRVQPQMVVPVLLMVGTLPGPGCRLFGLAALAAQWTWAGLHKIFSEHYVAVFGKTMDKVFPFLSDGMNEALCHSIAYGELAMGLTLCFLPFHRWLRLRWAMVGAVLGLHLGIVVSLAVVEHNPSVWPWNIAVAGVATTWILRADQSLLALLRASPWIPRIAVVVLLLGPGGFYRGWVHPYLAFVLYSSNAPYAQIRSPNGEFRAFRYLDEFESFIPPTARNYRRLFLRRCKPGEEMVIVDYRKYAKELGQDRVVVHCGERED